jgi:HNH endonuclease/NUMOD4 motif
VATNPLSELPDERWRPVLGFEDSHEVSDQGNVRSIPRTVLCANGKTMKLAGKVLTQHSQTRGTTYWTVHLQTRERDRNAFVQVLVLEAFVGPRPEGKLASHKNGDGLDNRLSNLKWGTQSAVARGQHSNGRRESRPNRSVRSESYTLPGERWAVIPGTNGRYEASDQGRIRSTPYEGRGPYPAGKVLAQHEQNGMHYVVRLKINGRYVTSQVQTLVLEAFVEPRPKGKAACHLNDDGFDNRLSNLKWDTQSAIVLQSFATGGRRNVTHCPHGHEYTPDNIIWRKHVTKDGLTRQHRACRECINERFRKYRERNR